MSVTLIALVWATRLTASEKLVLLRLADRVNEYQLRQDAEAGSELPPLSPVVFASLRSLERDCGLTRKAVIKALRRLLDTGYLELVEGGTGTRARRFQLRTSTLNSGGESTPQTVSGVDSTPQVEPETVPEVAAVSPDAVAVSPDTLAVSIRPASGAPVSPESVLTSTEPEVQNRDDADASRVNYFERFKADLRAHNPGLAALIDGKPKRRMDPDDRRHARFTRLGRSTR